MADCNRTSESALPAGLGLRDDELDAELDAIGAALDAIGAALDKLEFMRDAFEMLRELDPAGRLEMYDVAAKLAATNRLAKLRALS